MAAAAITIITAAAASGRVSRSAPASGRSYGYYGSSPYYYDDGYYDEGVVLRRPLRPATMPWRIACRGTDPTIRRSGTYLGYDGQRHPCP